MNNFVFKKYVQFIERNGYFPMMFNPYNCSEITDISPTLTANCGSKGLILPLKYTQNMHQHYVQVDTD